MPAQGKDDATLLEQTSKLRTNDKEQLTSVSKGELAYTVDTIKKLPADKFNEVVIALFEELGFGLEDAKVSQGTLVMGVSLQDKHFVVQARQDEAILEDLQEALRKA